MTAALLASVVLVAMSGGVVAAKDEAWVPPGLSDEERQEWKGGKPPGWTQGAKRGWRGKDCPPGLAKKGKCSKQETAAAATDTQKTLEKQVAEGIERLKKWGREKMKLSPAVVDAMLIGFEGAARSGVPVATAEQTVMATAEKGIGASGIEVITRALAYGATHGGSLADLEAFVRQGLARGVAADALALGVYRQAVEARK
ncbi:MAG: hypothetical protein HY727_20215 [Candidatus Rokubacteria bacterium]|nr:hypothetical protein [Candidatus Rokubacteria bacterium]